MENYNKKMYLAGSPDLGRIAVGNLTPCMPSPEQERGELEVTSKLKQLECIVDNITARIEKLAARLEPIRRPIDGKEPRIGHGACPAACKIGGTLEDLIQRLHCIGAAIDDVDNTLEI